MAPVEGDRWLGEKPRGRVESTEPGQSQKLYDFDPLVVQVECDPNDNFGVLRAEGDHTGVEVQVLREKRSVRSRAYAELLIARSVVTGEPKPTVFLGSDRIVVKKKSELGIEEIIFRHEKGSPQEPPVRSERIPRNPIPPRRDRREVVSPREEVEPEVIAVGKKL